MIGTTEIALIVGAVVILFGAKRLPELARGMGEGIREFKKSMKEESEEKKAEEKKE